jgi:hypothetical protein
VSGLVQGANVFINNTGCSKGSVDIRKVSDGEILSAAVLITSAAITITANRAMAGPYNITFLGVV